MEREEIEQTISDNLDVPKNIRIVCRTVDITDPVSIEKCSVETCRTIIVNPTDDMETIKAVLAVSKLLDEKGVPEISVNAIVSKDKNRFPPSLVETNNIMTLQTNTTIAKMIAHSCTQTGLSDTFREVFNFEGSEFYLISIPGIGGLSFLDLMDRLDNGVPSGVYRDGTVRVNPPADYLIRQDDRILVFSEESKSAILGAESNRSKICINANIQESGDITDTVIIGHNETLPIILRELPENVSHVYLVGQETTQEEKDELQEIASERNLLLKYIDKDPHSEAVLLELAN